jgi:hypothetical protein
VNFRLTRDAPPLEVRLGFITAFELPFSRERRPGEPPPPPRPPSRTDAPDEGAPAAPPGEGEAGTAIVAARRG